jgi:hypothetical protein
MIDDLDGLRSLIAAAQSRAETYLDRYGQPRWVDGRLTVGAPLVTSTRAAAKSVFADISAANDLLEDLAVQLPQAWAREQYTVEARAGQANDLLSGARGQVAVLLDRAAATVVDLRARLVAAALPDRPTPTDAAQEAALSGMKTDLRMLFDATAPADLPQVMLDQLGQYVRAGDGLGMWLLAGDSGWASLYLRSRAGDPDQAHVLELTYGQGVADQLRSGDVEDTDAEFARGMLEVIDGKRGLQQSLVAMGVLVRLRLDQLASVR